MADTEKFNRREVLTLALGLGGALLLTFPLTGRSVPEAGGEAAPETRTAQTGLLRGTLEIAADNRLFLHLNHHEMGQGITLGIRTLLAEELNTAPEMIEVRLISVGPLADPTRSEPLNTGGSLSMRESWQSVRDAGAHCRVLLLKSAALKLKAEGREDVAATLALADGHVSQGRHRLPFSSLLPWLPEAISSVDPALIAPKLPPWRFIGKNQPQQHCSDKVSGVFAYGIDRPCALIAVLERPPCLEAALTGFEREPALAQPGVKYVEVLRAGVAVVATNTWAALKGRSLLAARWQSGCNTTHSAISDRLTDLLQQPALAHTVTGDPDSIAGQSVALDRTYLLPMLNQAPMEPLSCGVSISVDRCELWVGTQTPAAVRELASAMTGLPVTRIQLHDQYSGGSFGRRLALDYIVEAIELGMRLQQPVKVVWTREDMQAGGYYRPPAAIRLLGYQDSKGNLTGLHHRIASPGQLWDQMPAELAADWKLRTRSYVRGLLQRVSPAQSYGSGVTESAVVGDAAADGARAIPYQLSHYVLSHIPVTLPMPMGYWRSVGNSLNLFALESFLDEWALQAGQDPLALRLGLLAAKPRLQRVLSIVTSAAQWQRRSVTTPLGLACFYGYGTAVATVVQLKEAATHPQQIETIFCAVDCGIAINPDNVNAQVEGAVTMGLSAALGEQIEIEDGWVTSRNFDRYRLLRIEQMPAVQITVVTSQDEPGGIGEPVIPTIAPALANAWRLLSGQNIASLPVSAVSKGST